MRIDSRGNRLPAPGENSSERLIASRAAEFINAAVRGDAVNKRLAQMLRCHPDTAYLLRKGDSWTLDRIAAAADVFGREFVDFVFSDAPLRQQCRICGRPCEAGDRLGELMAAIEATQRAVAEIAARVPPRLVTMKPARPRPPRARVPLGGPPAASAPLALLGE